MPAFDIDRYHAALRTKAFGRNLIFEPRVGSTMDAARAAAEGGAVEGTVALADEQTAGRGRLGRSWVAPPAVNLLPTLLLRPPAPVLRQIAMIAPLAVSSAIVESTGLQTDLKWPNDVQARGRKLAGILIETSITDAGAFVLVGAGINVNFDLRPYDEIRDIATSVAVELGHEVDREPLLAAYLAHFERMYEAARSGESVQPAWRARLITLGREVHASWPGGSADGLAEDVDESGALVIRTASGERVTVEAGDVTLRK
ncbi:MAG: biotin--[acetyl-CoA-carboxylase] ligase [Dehalococcoidia bacterium]|nr:biotin--[acetyl-CoA-carboxylase] ligase [Dehalococcoidia bacterium]